MLTVKLRRDLRKQPSQLAAVVLLVLMGVALFGASYDAYKNLSTSYNDIFVQQHFADILLKGGDSEQVAAQLQGDPRIDALQVRTVVDVPMRLANGETFAGRVVGLPPDSQPAVDKVTVDTGSYLSPSDPGGVLVDKHLADHAKLSPGGTLQMFYGGTWHTVTERGSVTSAEYLWPAPSRQEVLPAPGTFGVIFASEQTARSIARAMGVPAPNEVAVYYTDAARAEFAKVDAAIAASAPTLGFASSQTRAEQPSNAALGEDISGFSEMAYMFPMLFLGAAGLATYVVLTRRVVRDRAIIGMMRANGYRRGAITRHYMATGLLVGLAGSVVGVLVGLGLAGVVTRLYTQVIGLPSPVVQVRASTVAIGIAFGLVAGALSALGPAITAGRIAPAEAMRGVAPVTRGGRWADRFERLFPFTRRLSAGAWLVLRGPARQPRRTLYTEIGVVLALVLILVSWGMIDTMKVMMDKQYTKVQQQDAAITFSTPVDASVLSSIASVTGVKAVEPSLTVPITLANDGKRYSTALAGFEPGTKMHAFLDPSGAARPLPANGLLVASSLESLLNLHVGDTVNVILPTGRSVPAPVAGFVDEPLGSYTYASLSLLESADPQAQPMTALVKFDAGVNRDAMRKALSAEPNVIVYEDSQALRLVADQYLNLFYAFVGVMLLFGGMLAFTVLFATMSVNIAERQTEIATLRATGVSRRRLLRLVTLENLLVVLVGVIPGLILGRIAAAGFMDSFNSDLFRMSTVILPTTYILSALAVVVTALLAQIPGMRTLSRMDLATVVRERSA